MFFLFTKKSDICENIMKLPFKVGDSDIKAFMK